MFRGSVFDLFDLPGRSVVSEVEEQVTYNLNKNDITDNIFQLKDHDNE